MLASTAISLDGFIAGPNHEMPRPLRIAPVVAIISSTMSIGPSGRKW